MGHLSQREAKPILPVRYGRKTLRQSELRADNARRVLDWSGDDETRRVFSGIITMGDAEQRRRKGLPGPVPFGRAPTLLHEIRKRSQLGVPIPAYIWEAYDIEIACDARLAWECFRSRFSKFRRARKREDLHDAVPNLLSLETSPEIDAELWRVDAAIKIPTNDLLGNRALPASPIALARKLTRETQCALLRVKKEMSTRISKGQKHTPGPKPSKDVTEFERVHIIYMARAKKGSRAISKTLGVPRRAVELEIRKARARLGELYEDPTDGNE